MYPSFAMMAPRRTWGSVPLPLQRHSSKTGALGTLEIELWEQIRVLVDNEKVVVRDIGCGPNTFSSFEPPISVFPFY